MPSEFESNLRLEIGHVLFIDLVGYSKLLIDEQKERLRQLTDIVLATPQVDQATNEELVRLPTGDGMALVFRNSLEEPAQCALEIARALKEHPEIQVRMGIHSGPVSKVTDLNGRTNIAGAGINLAQRVMDCGDAGHILLSRHVVEDLAQYRQWSQRLHDLGECEVKHGIKLSLANLFGDDFGNAAVPAKLTGATTQHKATGILPIGLLVAAVLLLVAGIIYFRFKSSANFQRIRSAEAPPKSIAVLPFDNLSRDPENAYFSEGIQDEILTRLAKIAELKVISRTSTQRFKSSPNDLRQIAQQLGVANILEGSVQKANDQVRVNVQLINALTDAHLWADTYDRKLTDIFVIESDIAKTIADTLQAKLSRSAEHVLASRPTENPEAHELYLKGRFFWNKRTGENLKKAADYFNQAIAADPNYALAYAGLAGVYVLMPFYSVGAPRDCYPRAKAAAKKALEQEDALAEAHTALAQVHCYYDFDFSQATSEFQRAIELNPNYATAHQWYGNSALVALGRFDEAIAEVKRAIELDPLSLVINTDLGATYYRARRYDEAIEQLHKTLELDPGFYYARWNLGSALSAKGAIGEAIGEYQKARALNDDPLVLGLLTRAYAFSGNKTEAIKLRDQLATLFREGYVSAYSFALVSIGFGDKEEALRWLEKSYQYRAGNDLEFIRVEPLLDPLRGDPRFEALMAKVFSTQKSRDPSP